MRGSVYKRCTCRDATGKRVRSCRKNHGSWAFTIDAGRDTATGKRKQVVRSGFRTRDEAAEAMTAEIADLNAGVWTDDKNITVGDWLDQWLKEQVDGGLAAKTLSNYGMHISVIWKPSIGTLRLRDLRRVHVERALSAAAAPRQGKRPPGNVGLWVSGRQPTTLDGYRRTLRAALAVAQRRNLIAVNHAAGRMESIPTRRKGRDLPIWEPEETAKFLGHVEGDALAALYEIAAYTGLRRAELCGIRWSDIDIDGGGLTVRQTCVELTRKQALRPADLICPACGEIHTGRVLKDPKTSKGWRWVPLAAPAQRALVAHRANQDSDRKYFGNDYANHDLIFCRISGEPLRPSQVTAEFKAHVRQCGLPPIRLHDMRHGACSLLLAGGVPIEIVQLVLGHSSPEVTRQIYAHVMRGATSAQVETATGLLTNHRREQSVSIEAQLAAFDPSI